MLQSLGAIYFLAVELASTQTVLASKIANPQILQSHVLQII